MIKTSFTILFGLIFYSCTTDKNSSDLSTKTKSLFETSKSATKINKKDIPFIKLELARGAFHYDCFELKGNELRFIPSDESFSENQTEYETKSKVILSDSIVLNLINELIANNIFDMDSVYSNMTSCNSMLEIKLKVHSKYIHIKCDDYQRGCPTLISELETKLIKLHGKNLIRIFLPG